MDRCKVCGHLPLDTVEYLEEQLPGVDAAAEVIRVIIVYCDSCGWSESRRSKAVPVPA